MNVQDHPHMAALSLRNAGAGITVQMAGSGDAFLALLSRTGEPWPLADDARAGATLEPIPMGTTPLRESSRNGESAAVTMADGTLFRGIAQPYTDSQDAPVTPWIILPSPEVSGSLSVADEDATSVAPSDVEAPLGSREIGMPRQPGLVEDRTAAPQSSSGSPPKDPRDSESGRVLVWTAPTGPQTASSFPHGSGRGEATISEGDRPAPPAVLARAVSGSKEEPATLGFAAQPSQVGDAVAQRVPVPRVGTLGKLPEGMLGLTPIPQLAAAEVAAQETQAMARRVADLSETAAPPAPAPAVGSPVSGALAAEGEPPPSSMPAKPEPTSPAVTSHDMKDAQVVSLEAPDPKQGSRNNPVRSVPPMHSVIAVLPVNVRDVSPPPEHGGDPEGPLPSSPDPRASANSTPASRYALVVASSDLVPISTDGASDSARGGEGDAEESIAALHATDAVGTRKTPEVAVTNGTLPAAEVARNTGLQIVTAVSGAEGTVEIQLSPEELGRVTLTLQVTDDGVVLAIQAERQETLDLMRRHADILQREFREAGFTSLSFSFGQEAQDGRPGRAPATETTRFEESGPGSTLQRALPEDGRVPASSRLDLRL